jgi:hypothetical protein
MAQIAKFQHQREGWQKRLLLQRSRHVYQPNPSLSLAYSETRPRAILNDAISVWPIKVVEAMYLPDYILDRGTLHELLCLKECT